MFDLSSIAATPGLTALEYRPEVGSTNDLAIQFAADEQRRLPLLVLTSRQTGGRGRGVNRWWAAEGSLTFSLLVDCSAWNLALERIPRIALIAGLAVCESLQQSFPEGVFGLKWPNDVFLHGRKVCGILVEMPSQGQGRLIVGVGINVNNSFADAPPELRAIAASLADVAGGTFDPSETLSRVVERMLIRFDDFRHDGLLPVAEIARYSLLSGRTVEIESGKDRIAGRCEGIDEEGRLVLHTADGLRRLYSGVVRSF